MGGVIARGNYAVVAENHGKRAYKRDTQVNGLDVMVYYWDERDGPSFCGWWFGPKVGGDQVWAYHADKSAQTPPRGGWKVPYDGAVDQTMQLSPKQAGQPPAQQQFQQQPQQQQWPQVSPQQQLQHQQMQLQMQQQQAVIRQQQEEQKRKLE